MKKLIAWFLALACFLALAGCSRAPKSVQTIEGNLKTYTQMSDGTWECEGQIYKYRLEIWGVIPYASTDSTFTYLSNMESISFEQAYLAAGVSSDLNDYFAPEDAVLVDWLQTPIELTGADA